MSSVMSFGQLLPFALARELVELGADVLPAVVREHRVVGAGRGVERDVLLQRLLRLLDVGLGGAGREERARRSR